MAITAKMYGAFLDHLVTGRINWMADDIALTLHTSGYVPNQDTHDFADDLTNELPTGNGYTVGGVLLTGKTDNYDAATNTEVIDAADISIANTTLTWRVAVLRKRAGTAATSPLIAYFVSDVDIISSGGITAITMPSTGIIRLSTAA